MHPDDSDRILRIFGKVVALFEGDVESARTWLSSPQRALGEAVPLEMATTEIGAREVEDLIGRIEHGVLS